MVEGCSSIQTPRHTESCLPGDSSIQNKLLYFIMTYGLMISFRATRRPDFSHHLCSCALREAFIHMQDLHIGLLCDTWVHEHIHKHTFVYSHAHTHTHLSLRLQQRQPDGCRNEASSTMRSSSVISERPLLLFVVWLSTWWGITARRGHSKGWWEWK